ncbi:MAG: hypothetical protein QNJ87_00710 [Gammaproteobacteria bacterium]|nr:hypothetical protein [Gammaproteobacteria bacterium]
MIQIQFTQFVGTEKDLLSEPSAVAQLSHQDGRFLIVNDTSPEKALFVAEVGDDGKLHSRKLDFPESPELDDLEGVVQLDDWLYVITSHSADDDEDANSARRIARFQLSGDRVSHLEDARGADHLKKRAKQALEAKHPQLDDKDFADEEFNIEGFANQGNEFLIGLRSPLLDEKALVVKTYGLRQAYGEEAAKYGVFASCVPLDLKNGGIRALSHVPDLDDYLLVSGKSVSGQEEFDCELATTPSKSKFLLWFWDGQDRCTQVACFDMEQDGVKVQPEGVSPATVDGRQTICIVSDDGDEKEERPGRYSLLSETQYEELKALLR